MKHLISGLAFAGVVLGATTAGAFAADPTATPPAVTAFLIVDKASGQVLGELVPTGNNTKLIAALAERARAATLPTIGQETVRAAPKTAAEWETFWRSVFPPNTP